jgi:type VII secretion protein EccE
VPRRRPTTPRRRGKSSESSGLRSTTDIRAQRLLPLVDLIVLQLLVTAGIVTALSFRFPGWQGGAVGLGVALLLVFRWRGKSLPRLIARWTGFARERRKRAQKKTPAEPFDVPTAEGALIGFRWDGRTLLSVLKSKRTRGP